MKTLKLWNGRSPVRDYAHVYIAAYSQADAIRLLEEYNGHSTRGIQTEFKVYYAKCWGNKMKDVTPERGIWVVKDNYIDSPLVRLI